MPAPRPVRIARPRRAAVDHRAGRRVPRSRTTSVKTELARIGQLLAADRQKPFLDYVRQQRLIGAQQALGWQLYRRQLQRPSETWRPAEELGPPCGRPCTWCGKPLPLGAATFQRYHGGACAQEAKNAAAREAYRRGKGKGG